ncbi:quinone-dependent dihydroorotate dehydrogenase [Cellulomonas chengniuliangii]|uniref:Dihydroorotate dehydrogenase (quinone) n=1 Tax=Cellulomonas chengniuliangii TaxID=2968084 RepID=A0ABY5L052_9CELL|nr:quinone-dependent dihydroorotate dehydrogenase [Cellulomonas chengniuliangii]MCC2308644.1 quinone-dependent dihydroorotate dehydrogenase [Cellulomonas chengniuliangii]UUI74003.1 quinone-dependent dihydroorotate dehydrogenase [Cellulomonas chengniuliangii]
MYHLLFNLVFRRMDPERAHEVAFRLIRLVAAVPVLGVVVARLSASQSTGAVRALGRVFPAPFGLAAGFDKNALGVAGLRMLGFGFVEIGTVTAHPQPGNEPPRLWRVLDQRALRNRMGFNNQGSAEVARRLQRLRSTPGGRSLVIGVNIGKTKVTPAEDAAHDYAISARRLGAYADYLVVNVSSPNTPGLRDLQSVESLRPILQATRAAADEATAAAGRPRVPLLVKIAPDLSDEDVDAVADLALELDLDGVVAVNTTIAHDLGEGGLSGPPLLSRGLDVVARLRTRLGPEPVIMGVGGITTAADAREYLAVGATLVQGYTGLIYEGPFWAAGINKALARDAARGPHDPAGR